VTSYDQGNEQIAATTAALRDAIAPLLFTRNPG